MRAAAAPRRARETRRMSERQAQPPRAPVRNIVPLRRRRRMPWWRWLVTGALACGVVGATLYYLAVTNTRVGGVPLLPVPQLAEQVARVPPPGIQSIVPLDEAGRRHNEQQREIVAALARRYVGAEPRGTRADLRILQRIIDTGVLDATRTYELQALGVVLGDVLAEELGLDWVVVRDEYGRSRALRFGDTDNLIFPVTMISKRIEAGLPVDVEALYEKAVAALDGLLPARTARTANEDNR